MKVNLRRERDFYLAYFIDSRTLVKINESGSIILDQLFNQERDIDDVVKNFSEIYDIPILQSKDDIKEFLIEIENEIQPSNFNILEQEQLELPLGVELEITTSCNLRCLHCFQESYNDTFMPTQKAIKIINCLADHHICEVSLIGGEPFKHEGLMEIINCCEKRQLAINIVTNGTLLNHKDIEKLADIDRLVIFISLDGPEHIHNKIRGKNVFYKVDKTIKDLIDKGVQVEIIYTLNSLNVRYYKEIIDYCEKLGIPCNFNLFKPLKNEHENLNLHPKIFFETVVDLFTLRKEKGYQIGISNAAITSFLIGLPLRNECKGTCSGLVIDVNGRMITCPLLFAAGYYQGVEMPLFDEKFVEKWLNHHIFNSFREGNLKECQARAFIFNKDINGCDPYGINSFIRYWDYEKSKLM